MLSSIYQTFKPFISFLDIVFLLHICNMLCIAPSYLSPAVHHLSRLLGDIYNEVIFTGHPLLLFTTPLGHNGHLSVNELLLSFFSFFFQSTVSLFPAAWWRMKSLTPIPSYLSGEDTHSIRDPSWCNWILHSECNMELDPGVPLLLPFFLFFFPPSSLEPLKGLCCGPFVCVWGGTDGLNDDRWQTRG